MKIKTTQMGSELATWQMEDAARLKALFRKKKLAAKSGGENLTQETLAERSGISSGQMVWQYMNAHRPLNIQAAAGFARGLGVSVMEFSPTLATQIEQVSGSESPRPRLAAVPVERYLLWVSADVAKLISHYEAVSPEDKEAALSFVESLPKIIVDTSLDRRLDQS